MTTPFQTGFSRILVPVDGSEHGLHAARTAARLARALGARMMLLTVYHPPSSSLGEPYYSAALNEALDAARQAVEAARQAAREAADVEPEMEWLGGPPAETILSAARDGEYDLIVMGTRGRGRLRTALLGSISNAVAAHAGRPVLLVGEGIWGEPGGGHSGEHRGGA